MYSCLLAELTPWEAVKTLQLWFPSIVETSWCVFWLAVKGHSTRSHQNLGWSLADCILLVQFLLWHLLLLSLVHAEDDRWLQLPVRGEIFFYNFHGRQDIKQWIFLYWRKELWYSVESVWMSHSNWASSTFDVTLSHDTPLLLFSTSTNISGVRINLPFCSIPAILLLVPSMIFSSHHLSFVTLAGICSFETNLIPPSLPCISFQLWLSKMKNYKWWICPKEISLMFWLKSFSCSLIKNSPWFFGWGGLSVPLVCGSPPHESNFWSFLAIIV